MTANRWVDLAFRGLILLLAALWMMQTHTPPGKKTDAQIIDLAGDNPA